MVMFGHLNSITDLKGFTQYITNFFPLSFFKLSCTVGGWIVSGRKKKVRTTDNALHPARKYWALRQVCEVYSVKIPPRIGLKAGPIRTLLLIM